MRATSTPVERRIGVVAVEQPDGSFVAVRVGLFPKGMQQMSDQLRPYQEKKYVNRLVRRGHTDVLGPKPSECKGEGESAVTIKEPFALMARLKEIGGRYAAVRRLKDTRFEFWSLSEENETRPIFTTRSVAEQEKFIKQNQPV